MPYKWHFCNVQKLDPNFVSMTRYMKKKEVYKKKLQFFDKYQRGTSHNLKMNNGDLLMHIHQRLTFEMELRMCVRIVI